MIEVIGIMIAGMLVGYICRIQKMAFLSKAIMIAICMLLLSLGFVVGNNKAILNNLDTIGWQSFVLCLGAVLGSVLLASAVYHFFFKNKPLNK